MKSSMRKRAPGALLLLMLTRCASNEGTDQSPDFATCDEYEPLRVPLFGDLHVHTSLSYDANLSGTRLGPRTAYRFARGERIDITPYDEDGNALRTLQLERPLDFAAVTDHSAYFGATAMCRDPTSVAYDHPQCQQVRNDPEGAFLTFALPFTLSGDHPRLCGESGQDCIDANVDVWAEVQAAANEANDESRACEFTSFVAFEWTASPGGNNMHRNVLFRSSTVPAVVPDPFNAKRPEAMWQMLRDDCIDADDDCDVITLAHNTNLSAATYFQRSGSDDLPIDAQYLRDRAVMEPAIEIYQQKGSSECSALAGAPDELCGFEDFPFENFTALSLRQIGAPLAGGFARDAFTRGLELEAEYGINPFQYAVIAGTDAHMANPGAVTEYDHPGNGDAVSKIQESPDPLVQGLVDDPYFGSGGLAGVWAEENSREAIFDAIVRKETFGTSGPRIVPRLFGGWDYPVGICDRPSLENEGYDGGVPMGGRLSPVPESGAAPVFVAFARQAAGTEANPGTPLQRIQLIKGSLDADGIVRTRVIELTPGADRTASVDLDTCAPSGGGYASLCHRWVDDDFDPDARAYYYIRILENPTCRWSVRQCIEHGYDCENPSSTLDADCCDPVVGLDRSACDSPEPGSEVEIRCNLPQAETAIQERAWTSPIWYSPS